VIIIIVIIDRKITIRPKDCPKNLFIMTLQ
jgi:hypothetical protein